MIIVSTSPIRDETDVVLGRPVEIVFDEAVDPATVTSASFSLMGPGQTSVVDADEMVRGGSTAKTGREYIPGKFSFPSPERLVFTPDRSLRPNVIYTVLVTGKASLLAKSFIAGLSGATLAASVQFTFKTGELSQAAQPPASPLVPVAPWEQPRLDPTSIIVRPRKVTGNDLTQEIELLFPGPIDPASFDPEEIIVAAEPFLNDPRTQVPESSAQVRIEDNRILITLTWGNPEA